MKTMEHSFRHGLAFGTSKAIDKMKVGKHGDTITRDEMSQITGESCELLSRGYSHVQSAIRRVEVEFGVVWRWHRELQAWYCLDDSERVKCAGGLNRVIAKRANRSLRVSATVDDANLSESDRRDHQLNIIASGIASMSVSSPFRKRLKGTMDDNKKLIGPDYERLASLVLGKESHD
jgi:hypothetical protein